MCSSGFTRSPSSEYMPSNSFRSDLISRTFSRFSSYPKMTQSTDTAMLKYSRWLLFSRAAVFNSSGFCIRIHLLKSDLYGFVGIPGFHLHIINAFGCMVPFQADVVRTFGKEAIVQGTCMLAQR